MENEEEEEEEEGAELENANANAKKKKKKNKRSNNKRFSEEQVKQLEGIFEAETKIEPRRKVEVAAKLGLQPRQVAIWFQNKRARWKSKRIEMDYQTLRHDYDDLVAKFEGLKKERLSLLSQLNNLNDLMEKPSPEIFTTAEEGGTRSVFKIENTAEEKDENMKGYEEAVELKLGEEVVKMGRKTEDGSFGSTEKDLSDLDLDLHSDSYELFDGEHQSCSSVSWWLDFLS